MLNYLKSSISISSYDGCSIGCKYCILSTLKDRAKIRKVADEEELVQQLLSFRLYTTEVPISINNQTDPLLNDTIFFSTVKILQILERQHVENPILIITKGYMKEDYKKMLQEIKLKIVILYTFSGLSKTMENRDEQLQIETLKMLSELPNIKLVHYYRPVIECLNSNEDIIKHIANIVTKYCRASIISGIRINSYLRTKLMDLKIELPEKYDPDHKVLLPETYQRILNIFKQTKENYPVFKKTSCGVSYILGMPDYNGHSARIYYCNPSCVSYPICIGTNKIGFCNSSCPNYERCKAESEKKVSEEMVKKLLEKIGKADRKFFIKEHYIQLEGEYWQEEVSFMRHSTKKNFKADSLLKREDEFLISQ